jgi:hypothetical protein
VPELARKKSGLESHSSVELFLRNSAKSAEKSPTITEEKPRETDKG